MIEQKLKNFKAVTVNDATKRNDWERIVQKDRKRPTFYWREMAALVAVVVLALSLTFLMNKTTGNENQASNPFVPVETIYYSHFAYEGVIPKANFYPYVRKFDGESLNEINDLLSRSTWQQIELPYEHSHSTYKFVFADGTSKILRNYNNKENSTEYLYDEKTGYAYVIPYSQYSDTVHERILDLTFFESADLLFVKIFPLLLIMLISIVKDFLYKKKMGLKKLPKRYSSYKQLAAQLLIILPLIGLTVYTQNVHFIWWVMAVILNMFVFRLLDDQSEHYKWRFNNCILVNVLILVILSVNFYYIY